jgi:hypothetical protein
MPKDVDRVRSEVNLVAYKEWESFLKQLKVVRIGYDRVDLKRAMEWYDRVEAPFQPGKKRKEFFRTRSPWRRPLRTRGSPIRGQTMQSTDSFL